MNRLKNGLVFEGVKLVVVKNDKEVVLVNKMNGKTQSLSADMVNEYAFTMFEAAKYIGCGIPTLHHLLATVNGILSEYEKSVIDTIIVSENED